MDERKIIIPKPCDEGWDNMAPRSNGRHCDSCNKTVVDFTKMSLEEIKDYFHQHQSKKICGHFKATQVELNRPALHNQLIRLYDHIEKSISIHFLKTISLSFVAVCMTLIGCQSQTKGEKVASPNCNNKEQHVTGDSVNVVKSDTLTVDGLMAPPPDSIKRK